MHHQIYFPINNSKSRNNKCSSIVYFTTFNDSQSWTIDSYLLTSTPLQWTPLRFLLLKILLVLQYRIWPQNMCDWNLYLWVEWGVLIRLFQSWRLLGWSFRSIWLHLQRSLFLGLRWEIVFKVGVFILTRILSLKNSWIFGTLLMRFKALDRKVFSRNNLKDSSLKLLVKKWWSQDVWQSKLPLRTIPAVVLLCWREHCNLFQSIWMLVCNSSAQRVRGQHCREFLIFIGRNGLSNVQKVRIFLRIFTFHLDWGISLPLSYRNLPLNTDAFWDEWVQDCWSNRLDVATNSFWIFHLNHLLLSRSSFEISEMSLDSTCLWTTIKQ